MSYSDGKEPDKKIVSPENLYTKETFVSLSGAVVIVTAVTTTLIYFVPSVKGAKIIPFFISFIVSFAGLSFLDQVRFSDKVLAFFNSFVIFIAACGLNVVTSPPPSQGFGLPPTIPGESGIAPPIQTPILPPPVPEKGFPSVPTQRGGVPPPPPLGTPPEIQGQRAPAPIPIRPWIAPPRSEKSETRFFQRWFD